MKIAIVLLVLLAPSLPAREKAPAEPREARRHHFWQSKRFWETTALAAGAGVAIGIAAQPGSCVPVHGGGVYGAAHPNGTCLQPLK